MSDAIAAEHPPELSLVIPAFNEEHRLPPFLQTVRPYLLGVFGDSHEVIVVDDGSRDGTARVVEEAGRAWPQLRLIRHEVNVGKGRAVRAGVLASRGELVLFADADGSAPIAEEAALRSAIAAGADVAAGSRLAAGPRPCSRPWHRGLIGRAFAALVWLLVGLPIRDTQCGFKMFRGPVARHLFALCSQEDYLFDVFVLLLARKLGYSTVEVGVAWHDTPGSRLSLLRDSAKMALGLTTIRRKVNRVVRAQPNEPRGLHPGANGPIIER